MNDLRRSENPTKPTTSDMTVEQSLEKVGIIYRVSSNIDGDHFYIDPKVVDIDIRDKLTEAIAAIEAHYAAKQLALIDRIQQSLDQHTTSEGRNLLTRSYINNTLRFERERLNNTEEV